MSDFQLPAVRVKFCGITRVEDAALASSLGADAVGMIFYKKSARNISISQAREIVAVVSPLCNTVAVVVNPSVDELEDILAQVPINLLQFHGDESPEFCEQFHRPYIKAISMRVGTDLADVRRRYASARALLLDTFDKQLVGGTGRIFDWGMLDDKSHHTSGPGMILAGGLSPENVAAAVADTGIRHLDVNSGIESAPGVKDHKKMRAVMRNVMACA